MSQMKDISIVIIGRNAEWSIARLLDSVASSVPANLPTEVIYVDSASSDRTLEIVGRYPVKPVCLTASQRLCASAGRFVGSQYATGKYVVFADSDMELLNGWLERAVQVLDRFPKIAVVSGRQIDTEGQLTSETAAVGGCEENSFKEIRFAGSAAMFRREVLDVAGSWNPYIISDEEPELCLRIRHAGYRIVELQCPSVRHYGYLPPTIGALLSRRKRRLFVGYGQVIRYHLRTGLLSAYLKERGWVVIPALAGAAAAVAVLASLLSGNIVWLLGVCATLLLVFAADALRSHSFYKACFHMLHRTLILEGTIRGVFMRPHPSNEYPHDAQGVSANRASIDPTMSTQRSA